MNPDNLIDQGMGPREAGLRDDVQSITVKLAWCVIGRESNVITLANHRGHRQSSEPIKTRSKCMERRKARENVGEAKMAPVFQANRVV